ncbi:flagellar assembly protein FliH [Enterovibrio norvegicus]|uniref:flagellar assembly protein FliH n=1 Tax=Enterovibrio norvegicus TaxID=188144 RepID=UPI00352C07AA
MSFDRRRGYIRSTEQEEGVLERWSIPNYDPNAALPKETALNYDPGWEPSDIEEEPEEPEIDFKMLTPDALEQIRHSAYEEGMEEGRDAGFTEGRDAGFEEGKTAGFDAGKEEGFQEGLTEGQQLIENRCQYLDAIIEKLAFPLTQVDHHVHQQVMDMVIQLTKAVIQAEVLTNPQVILNTLREAVAALPMAGRQIAIYLHPEDMDVVTEAHSAESLQDRQWKLFSEPSLNRGDIQVACGDSVVDYRMDDRIKQLLTRFAGQNLTSEPELPEDGAGADVLRHVDISDIPAKESKPEPEPQQEMQDGDQQTDSDAHLEPAESDSDKEAVNMAEQTDAASGEEVAPQDLHSTNETDTSPVDDAGDEDGQPV